MKLYINDFRIESISIVDSLAYWPYSTRFVKIYEYLLMNVYKFDRKLFFVWVIKIEEIVYVESKGAWNNSASLLVTGIFLQMFFFVCYDFELPYSKWAP